MHRLIWSLGGKQTVLSTHIICLFFSRWPGQLQQIPARPPKHPVLGPSHLNCNFCAIIKFFQCTSFMLSPLYGWLVLRFASGSLIRLIPGRGAVTSISSIALHFASFCFGLKWPIYLSALHTAILTSHTNMRLSMLPVHSNMVSQFFQEKGRMASKDKGKSSSGRPPRQAAVKAPANLQEIEPEEVSSDEGSDEELSREEILEKQSKYFNCFYLSLFPVSS